MDVEARLEELGITLPEPASSVANYVPYVVMGDLLLISGQLPFAEGRVITGRLGENMSIEEGIAAARACGIGILAQIKAAVEGDWRRVRRIVRLGGFVNSADGFTDQPRVINGASDLMVDVFGEAGRHARAAVGVNTLPLGAAVEVEATVLIRS
ncbi:MAG: RidA family protein [Alphaproteobacteria bacterium]|nr:MAG: RidA family protein [Alphaproteobacteria bacterium]